MSVLLYPTRVAVRSGVAPFPHILIDLLSKTHSIHQHHITSFSHFLVFTNRMSEDRVYLSITGVFYVSLKYNIDWFDLIL
jgi:hypothetical protein